jgi:hypothetical protein
MIGILIAGVMSLVLKTFFWKKAKAMDNEFEVLYYKKRNTKGDIIAILQDRLN